MSPVPEPNQGGRIGPGNGEEDEEMSPPVGLYIGPPLSSSDEELEPAEPYATGYQPLSQENDLDEEDSVDYSTLSGLMSSLTAHGPNIMSDRNVPSEADGRSAEINSSIHLSVIEESTRERRDEVLLERAAIWNSSPVPDRLVLDGSKVEEIKNVMASFTLPQSAIPLWAQDLSEDDWKEQVTSIISRKTS